LKESEKGTSDITAAILAGGLGTRLRSVVSDKPKVLAEVCGRAFIEYLLDQLADAGIREVVVCSGYMGEKLEERLGDRYKSLNISYSREDKPLGTGGALRLALPCLKSDTVLVMNGDSYIDVDIGEYAEWFSAQDSDTAIVLTQVPDTSRYGAVQIDRHGKIRAFKEKKRSCGRGWINAGVYLMKRDLIAYIPAERTIFLEKELFPRLTDGQISGFCCQGRFIDIGTPQSYAEAESFFGEKKD
jgi:D-glycero-alpha-D-manno-heptose 1-phosphate guanylyltransferase